MRRYKNTNGGCAQGIGICIVYKTSCDDVGMDVGKSYGVAIDYRQ